MESNTVPQSPIQNEDNEVRPPVYQQTPAQPPQAGQAPQQPQMVYLTRPLEPVDPHISEEVRAKHEASRRKYPSLNLSEGEFVISAVKRHPIGLLSIWIFTGLTIALLMGVNLLAAAATKQGSVDDGGLFTIIDPSILLLLTLPMMFLVFIGGFIAAYVYSNNRFFLTNESVIQEIQTSLFSNHEQTVSLSNIEDASYRQDGILPHLLNYGSIRLSTEGDETTYRFSYVSNPKREIATLNNAVEAFKNGRPVH